MLSVEAFVEIFLSWLRLNLLLGSLTFSPSSISSSSSIMLNWIYKIGSFTEGLTIYKNTHIKSGTIFPFLNFDIFGGTVGVIGTSVGTSVGLPSLAFVSISVDDITALIIVSLVFVATLCLLKIEEYFCCHWLLFHSNCLSKKPKRKQNLTNKVLAQHFFLVSLIRVHEIVNFLQNVMNTQMLHHLVWQSVMY